MNYTMPQEAIGRGRKGAATLDRVPLPAARGTRLRILIVTPSLPYPPIWGFGIRVFQIIRHLAGSHKVSVLAYAEPDETEKVAALQQLGAAVHTVAPVGADVGGVASGEGGRGKRLAQLASLLSPVSYQSRNLRSPAMQAQIDRLVAGGAFDIIQVESSQMAGFHFGTAAALLIDEHNIEYELLYRMYQTERSLLRRLFNGAEYLKFRREERRVWDRAAGCILTSDREELILRQHAPARRTTVAANGVDIDFFQPTPTPPDPESLVFTGLMNYRPNTDAAVYFVREILPRIHRVRPGVTLSLVGASPPEEVLRLAGPRVLVTNRVPDVRPYVGRAAAVVVPLRMGSGTRLKVLEGLAMGKAMVSTSLGCEGIEVEPGEQLIVADEPDAFAGAVLRVLEDRALGATLGRNGRALVEREYSWASIVTGLEDFYYQVLEDAG